MKLIVATLIILASLNSYAQNNQEHLENALKKFNFIEEKVLDGTDTTTYYLKKYEVKPENLVLHIQGTGSNPIFSYKIENGVPVYYRWFGDDHESLDSNYTWAIIPKPGREGIFLESDIKNINNKFYQNDYQEYRVNQIDKSIEHIIHNHLGDFEDVIVYGHSEGATIAAALALKNKQITKLGFWSGNVLNNFYEFSLFNRIESLNRQITDSTAHENILGIIEWYKSVASNPNSTEIDHFGFTNKRWSSYEKPPIEDLLEIDIPIFALFATEDESTPIETAYLVPIQFLQNRKNNLTFKVCIGCDHNYINKAGSQEEIHWSRYFKEFIKWSKKEKRKAQK